MRSTELGWEAAYMQLHGDRQWECENANCVQTKPTQTRRVVAEEMRQESERHALCDRCGTKVANREA